MSKVKLDVSKELRRLHIGSIFVDLNESDYTELIRIFSGEKGQYSKNDIDLAYLVGVFNVSGMDGLGSELNRLKEIGKHPHEFFNLTIT